MLPSNMLSFSTCTEGIVAQSGTFWNGKTWSETSHWCRSYLYSSYTYTTRCIRLLLSPCLTLNKLWKKMCAWTHQVAFLGGYVLLRCPVYLRLRKSDAGGFSLSHSRLFKPIGWRKYSFQINDLPPPKGKIKQKERKFNHLGISHRFWQNQRCSSDFRASHAQKKLFLGHPIE